jgi:hypothetical protein
MNISPVADDLRRMIDAVVAVIDKIGKHRRPRRKARRPSGNHSTTGAMSGR